MVLENFHNKNIRLKIAAHICMIKDLSWTKEITEIPYICLS